MEKKSGKPTAQKMYRAEKERLEHENIRLAAEVERLERWRDAAAGEATIEIGRLADHSESLERENARLREALTRCAQLAEQADECTDWEYVGGCLRQIQRETSAVLEYTDS